MLRWACYEMTYVTMCSYWAFVVARYQLLYWEVLFCVACSSVMYTFLEGGLHQPGEAQAAGEWMNCL